MACLPLCDGRTVRSTYHDCCDAQSFVDNFVYIISMGGIFFD